MPLSSSIISFPKLSSVIILTIVHVFLNISPSCAFGPSPHPRIHSFGAGGDKILAAFADYDADRLTDVLMISNDLRTIHIILQREGDEITDTLFYESFNCSSSFRIVGLIPGDFDGDTRVDIAVVSLSNDKKRNRSQQPGNALPNDDDEIIYDIHVLTHRALTVNQGSVGPSSMLMQSNVQSMSEECEKILKKDPIFSSKRQPLMLDYNGDMICDLMVEDDKSPNRLIYLGRSFADNPDRLDQIFSIPGETPFSPKNNRMSKPHSSAFVDINGDQIVDIVITTTSNHIEYYYGNNTGHYGVQSHGEKYIQRSVRISLPSFVKTAGQSTYFDLDGDKRIEHIIPIINKNGKSQVIMLEDKREKKVGDQSNDYYRWAIITKHLVLANKTFNWAEFSHREIKFPITLRAGDIDNDGYNDVVTLVEDESTKEIFMAVLKNVKDINDEGTGHRTLELAKVYTDLKNPLVATFFDLAENGKLDIFLSTGNLSSTQLYSVENRDVLETSTNFLKVLVASGLCPQDGCIKKGWFWDGDGKDVVNYGSNIPGAYVTYNLLDANGNRKWSSAGQLSQSAHFSLQTPYMIFGLGELANYVDDIEIVLPANATSGMGLRDHTVEQSVVPDAHIVIIPRPPDQPKKWLMKLFLTAGDRIWRTVYTLLGICGVLIILIAILHKKEKLEDAPETKQFKQNWLDRR